MVTSFEKVSKIQRNGNDERWLSTLKTCSWSFNCVWV